MNLDQLMANKAEYHALEELAAAYHIDMAVMQEASLAVANRLEIAKACGEEITEAHAVAALSSWILEREQMITTFMENDDYRKMLQDYLYDMLKAEANNG